jgi:plasmid stabilization system protein ParE
MSKRVIIEPEAEADLREGYEWYEQQRSGLGDDFLLCFEAAIALIRERPESFPLVETNTRRILVRRFPYLALFTEVSDIIAVIGVFHTSRDPKAWKRRVR